MEMALRDAFRPLRKKEVIVIHYTLLEKKGSSRVLQMLQGTRFLKGFHCQVEVSVVGSMGFHQNCLSQKVVGFDSCNGP